MRPKISRRTIFWAIGGILLLLVFATAVVVFDRVVQRRKLELLGLDIGAFGAAPFEEALGEIGSDSSATIWWLELFAESYWIDCSHFLQPVENESELTSLLRGWPIERSANLDFRALQQLTDSDFEAFGKLPLLETLWLSSPELSDEVIPLIANQAPNLTELWLFDGVEISGTNLDQLKHIRSAGSPGGEFRLHLSSEIGDTGIENLAQHCPGISRLFLSRARLSDAGMEHLAGMTQLEALILGGKQVSASAESFRKLQDLTNLEYLQYFVEHEEGTMALLETSNPALKRLVISNIDLTLRETEKIHTFAPNLESLTLNMCNLENDVIGTLLPLKHLRELDLSHNPKITDAAEPMLSRFGASLSVRATGMNADVIHRLESRP